MMLINLPHKTYKILDINIHAFSKKTLEQLLLNVLISNNTPQLITTFNLDFLKTTSEDNEFNSICKHTLLNLPDGFGITNLISYKYGEKISRITGNDIFPLLIKLAKENNKKIAIIGGSTKVSKIVEKKILSNFNFDNFKLLCLSPPLNFENNNTQNNSVIKVITDFNPDIVFAALGCPRQEKWLFKNMNKFGSKINVGIGATLDYYSGEKKRSPIILQKVGLEWLWRLASEPKRLFERYILHDLPFFLKLLLLKNY